MTGPIARGTIRTTFVLGLRLAAQAGTLLIVARLLGPRQFGAFAGVASLAVMLGMLATFGTHLVLLGEVAKDHNRRLSILEYAIPITLACGGLLLVVYLAIAMPMLRGASLALHVVMIVGAAEILLQPLFSLAVHEHLALNRTARSQLLQTLPLALRLGAAATVWLIQPEDSLTAYAWGYIGASSIALVFANATLPAPWPRPSSWRILRPTELREAAGYAALNITRAGPTELDKTLALKLLPLASAGVYAASARVIGAIILPITAMTLSSLPRLFREGQEQSGRTTSLLRWMFSVTAIYGVVSASILWLLSPLFVAIFGAKYHGIDTVLRWLCLALPGMGIRLTAGNVLMAFGKPWMRVALEVTGLLMLVIASIILTVHLESLGMAIALACSEWSMAFVGMGLIIWTRTNSELAVESHQSPSMNRHSNQ